MEYKKVNHLRQYERMQRAISYYMDTVLETHKVTDDYVRIITRLAGQLDRAIERYKTAYTESSTGPNTWSKRQYVKKMVKEFKKWCGPDSLDVPRFSSIVWTIDGPIVLGPFLTKQKALVRRNALRAKLRNTGRLSKVEMDIFKYNKLKKESKRLNTLSNKDQ